MAGGVMQLHHKEARRSVSSGLEHRDARTAHIQVHDLADVKVEDVSKAWVSHEDDGVVIDTPVVTDCEARSLRVILSQDAQFVPSVQLNALDLRFDAFFLHCKVLSGFKAAFPVQGAGNQTQDYITRALFGKHGEPNSNVVHVNVQFKIPLRQKR